MKKKQKLRVDLLSVFYACESIADDIEDEKTLQIIGSIQVATQNGIIALFNDETEQAETILNYTTKFCNALENAVRGILDDRELQELN